MKSNSNANDRTPSVQRPRRETARRDAHRRAPRMVQRRAVFDGNLPHDLRPHMERRVGVFPGVEWKIGPDALCHLRIIRSGAGRGARLQPGLVTSAGLSTSRPVGLRPACRFGRPSNDNERKETQMRFMVLIKADKNSEAGVLPDEKSADGDGQLQRRAGQGGRDARRRGAAAELQRERECGSRAASGR